MLWAVNHPTESWFQESVRKKSELDLKHWRASNVEGEKKTQAKERVSTESHTYEQALQFLYEPI